MHKVTTVNLAGKAYQLEEAGYRALEEYLKQARTQLKDDPDKDEIMADFEQALADRCEQHLDSHKTVVAAEDIDQIIADMGPVDASEAGDEHAPHASNAARKGLFRIREGSMIAGVCTGLAAYFNIDVMVVRIIFLLLAFVSTGFWVIVYIALAIFIPEANTAEERANAHGQTLNAHMLLNRARDTYSHISTSKPWRQVAEQSRPALDNVGQAVGGLMHGVSAVCGIIFAVITTAFTVSWLVTLWSVIITNRVGGYTIDPHMARWLFAAWVSSGFFCLIVPLLACTLLFRRIAVAKKRPVRAWSIALGVVGFATALTLFIVIPLVGSAQIRNLATRRHGHTVLDFGGERYCAGDDTYCDQVTHANRIHTSGNYYIDKF